MGNTISEGGVLPELGETKGFVTFYVNGEKKQVGPRKVSVETSLASYLRENLRLTGTKISCNQGGCGACMVVAEIWDQNTGDRKSKAVNSCLVPVLSCHGWSITTIEGIGGKTKGYHPLQTTLTAKDGSQCGFCSPGMVMCTKALLQKKGNNRPSALEIEHNLTGNMCRCTGYRPILDAMKTFSADGDQDDAPGMDIEDMGDWVCPATKQPCDGHEAEIIMLADEKKKQWLSPTSVKELLTSLDKIPEGSTYKLICGNTGTGIYRNDDNINVHIDITRVSDLNKVDSNPLKFGGGCCLTDVENQLGEKSESDPEGYGYCDQIVKHLKFVASPSIKDIGSIGGNLMLKYYHNEFQSDVFNLIEAVGATIGVGRIEDGEIVTEEFLPSEWLNSSMNKRVVLYVILPKLTKSHMLKSYKITPRTAFAHAHVNSAFLYKLDDRYNVMFKPSLVYGGISATFFHAKKTENYLNGKNLNDNNVVKEAIKMLKSETFPSQDPHDPSAEYRTQLVQTLFYKGILDILGTDVDPKKRTGADDLRFLRPVSKAKQTYNTDKKQYPVNEPIEKLEGKLQTSGEAEFTNDIPLLPQELHGVLVTTTQANCELDVVDAMEALELDGVESFLDYRSIPGTNNTTHYKGEIEELFVSSKVEYAGQVVGIIMADTRATAEKAARMVKISYKNKQPPVLHIKEGLKDVNRVKELRAEDFKDKDISTLCHKPDFTGLSLNTDDELEEALKVSGEFEIGSQYHFHMETHSCICKPNEDGGLDVTSATQWMDLVQSVMATVLGLKENQINMTVRRLGGAYGGKTTNSPKSAAACGIAAFVLNRPVRLVTDIKANMESLGKRLPYLAKYSGSIDDSGLLTSIDCDMYCDPGFTFNEPTSWIAVYYAQGLYNSKAFKLKPLTVKTNTPSNTFCRAPGSTQGHAIMENIMEHLAFESGTDPLVFRLKNMVESGQEVVARVRTSSDYDRRKREIEQHNKDNLWTKRGISLTPVMYHHSQYGTRYHVHISVFHEDGSVAVTHGGIEMGQGINTKVAQIVAKKLDLPMDMIKIKPTNNVSNPNASFTAGSMGSEGNVAAALKACDVLMEKMAKVKADQKEELPWDKLVEACYMAGVDLTGHHMGHSIKDGIANYKIPTAVVCEVEIDVLTGVLQIQRVDFIEDVGVSTNPAVDIGQIEGGLIMGLGLWTCEEIKYDAETGQLLNNDTWHYKIPGSLDIPADMRIEMYDSGTNKDLVVGSKITGETSTLGGVSVLFAIRMAVTSARSDGGTNGWFQLDGPATAERIKMACAVKPDRLQL